jgi:hypothetical protein
MITGAMVLTVMPRLATSGASHLLAACSATFAAESLTWPRLPVMAATDEMLTTRPQRLRIINRISGRVTFKNAITATSMTLSHCTNGCKWL